MKKSTATAATMVINAIAKLITTLTALSLTFPQVVEAFQHMNVL